MSDQPIDEGVVKYHALHETGPAPSHPQLAALDEVRTQLFDLGLLGVYPNGIGYGNVSIRHESGCIISGTSTGSARELGANGYCVVLTYDLKKNTVHTIGPVQASSESMTHCAIYAADPRVQCVLHIHSLDLWTRLLTTDCPATPREVPYGTPEMAQSMAQLVQGEATPNGLLVMAGHEEGVIAYGSNIPEALAQIQAVLLA